MSVRIAQESHYQKDDWWRWSVWIEGTDRDLDGIKHVVYTLHPSFPAPVQTVDERSTKFRLDAQGWGTFRIHAVVHRKDGTSERLGHDLELLYEDGSPTTA